MFVSELDQMFPGPLPKGMSANPLDGSPELGFLDIAESLSVLGETFLPELYLDGPVTGSGDCGGQVSAHDYEDANHVDSLVDMFESFAETSAENDGFTQSKPELTNADSFCDVDQLLLPVDKPSKKAFQPLPLASPVAPSVLIKVEDDGSSNDDDGPSDEQDCGAVVSWEKRWQSLIKDVKIPKIANEADLADVKSSQLDLPHTSPFKRQKLSSRTVHDPNTCWVCQSTKSDDRKAALHRYIRKRNKRLTARPVRYEARSAVASGRSRQRGRFVESVQWVTL